MHEIAMFMISKSENKNQVHYAIEVHDDCTPANGSPVRAYWRMLEKGTSITEPLLEREQRAYGIAWQSVASSGVRIALRALPNRALDIRTWKTSEGTCSAAVTTTIANQHARLFNVHLALKFLGVDYLLLTGWTDDGRVIRERLEP